MRTFLQFFDELISPLRDLDYLYILLEPVFIYGLLFGLLGLIIAYVINNTPFQILTLSLIALSSITIFPYLSVREKSQQRIEQVYHIDSPNLAEDFRSNTQARQAQLWLYIVVFVTAGFAAMIGPQRNRLGLLFTILCIAFSSRLLQFNLSMHYQETLVFHSHLSKNDSPVQKRLEKKNTE